MLPAPQPGGTNLRLANNLGRQHDIQGIETCEKSTPMPTTAPHHRSPSHHSIELSLERARRRRAALRWPVAATTSAYAALVHDDTRYAAHRLARHLGAPRGGRGHRRGVLRPGARPGPPGQGAGAGVPRLPVHHDPARGRPAGQGSPARHADRRRTPDRLRRAVRRRRHGGVRASRRSAERTSRCPLDGAPCCGTWTSRAASRRSSDRCSSCRPTASRRWPIGLARGCARPTCSSTSTTAGRSAAASATTCGASSRRMCERPRRRASRPRCATHLETCPECTAVHDGPAGGQP